MKVLFSLLFCLLGISCFGQVFQIPTVVHVLWNDSTANVSEAEVLAILQHVNEDYRRLNGDTTQTPEYYSHLAADMEIEFVLADEDPFGMPTDGIIFYYTDSLMFHNDFHHMKNSNTGGADPWNPCGYFNFWIAPKLIQEAEIGDPSFSTKPWEYSEFDGVVTDHYVAELSMNVHLSRYTRLFGYYLGLLDISVEPFDSCFDADSVSDTPFSKWNSIYNPTMQCLFHYNTCGNVNPDMNMNYMAHPEVHDCVNMFTLGQKIRAHYMISTYRPGLVNWSICGLSADAREEMNFSLLPNPTTSSIQLSGINSGNYIILNLSGKMVDTGIINSNSISVEELPVGLYILKVQTENGVGHKRFVKQ